MRTDVGVGFSCDCLFVYTLVLNMLPTSCLILWIFLCTEDAFNVFSALVECLPNMPDPCLFLNRRTLCVVPIRRDLQLGYSVARTQHTSHKSYELSFNKDTRSN